MIIAESVESCSACGREFTDDDNQLWAMRTPPGSTTAGIVSACDDQCVAALDAAGYRVPSPVENDRLTAEVVHFGHRLPD